MRDTWMAEIVQEDLSLKINKLIIRKVVGSHFSYKRKGKEGRRG
jgi:hypothetical protein